MAEIAVNKRVYSDDYGFGKIILDMGSRVQIKWERPLADDHDTTLHDRSFVERLLEAQD